MHSFPLLRTCCGSSAIGPQRMKSIVGQHASPNQIPDCVQRLAGVSASNRIMHLLKEGSSMCFEIYNDRVLSIHGLWLDGQRRTNNGQWIHRPQTFQFLRQVKPYPPVPLANRIEPNPRHLTGRDQSIQVRSTIPVQASRQYLRLQNGSRQRGSLQGFDDVQQRIQSAPGLNHTLPTREQTNEHTLFHRLYFLAQASERLSPDRPQHFDVAPLAM